MTRQQHPRPLRLAALAAVTVVIIGASSCSASRSTSTARTLPRRVPSRTSVPSTTTSTTSTVLSAVPTTVPTPVLPALGWSTPSSTLAPAGGFTGVSCISDVLCVAAGGGANHADLADSAGAGVTESWDGVVWSSPSVWFPAPATGSITAPVMPAISCTFGPVCVVADGSGHASSGDGTTWSAPQALGGTAPPSSPSGGQPGEHPAAVSCAGGPVCAVADAAGTVAVWKRTTWTDLSTIMAGTSKGAVAAACASSSSCTVAIGTVVATWSGSTWTETTSPFGTSAGQGGTALACPLVRLCLMVHGSDVSLRSAFGTWSAPRLIDGNGSLDALSCPTATFCLAADAFGNVTTWDGHIWSAPHKVVPTPSNYTADGTAASCPDDQFCLVLNGDGDYATFQGAGPLTTPPTTEAAPLGPGG